MPTAAFASRAELLKCRASATRPSSRPPASCASWTATTRSMPPPCTPKPIRWSSASSPTSKSDLKALIGNSDLLKSLDPANTPTNASACRPSGHPQGTGKARPRPAPRVQDRHLQGRRREPEGPATRHDPGRRGHQRRQLRRLRRHRRASGRPGAHLRAVQHLRQGPAQRGQGRRHREGEGAGGGCKRISKRMPASASH
jgi:hypothetical protein